MSEAPPTAPSGALPGTTAKTVVRVTVFFFGLIQKFVDVGHADTGKQNHPVPPRHTANRRASSLSPALGGHGRPLAPSLLPPGVPAAAPPPWFAPRPPHRCQDAKTLLAAPPPPAVRACCAPSWPFLAAGLHIHRPGRCGPWPPHRVSLLIHFSGQGLSSLRSATPVPPHPPLLRPATPPLQSTTSPISSRHCPSVYHVLPHCRPSPWEYSRYGRDYLFGRCAGGVPRRCRPVLHSPAWPWFPPSRCGGGRGAGRGAPGGAGRRGVRAEKGRLRGSHGEWRTGRGRWGEGRS